MDVLLKQYSTNLRITDTLTRVNESSNGKLHVV